MHLIEINETNFESEIMQSEKPALVVFCCEKCARCKAIVPIIVEFAGEHADALKMGKINIEQEFDLARRFEIRTTPTLVYAKEGTFRGLITDFVSKKSLLHQLDALDHRPSPLSKTENATEARHT
jgi:thioredoxin 1